MRILAAESTELFVGSEQEPRQVLEVTLEGDGPVAIRVDGDGVSGEATATVPAGAAGGTAVEVGVAVPDGTPPGTRIPITVTTGDDSHETELVVAEPGWVVHLISHFHYDPVWWNTQAAYTTSWLDYPEGPAVDTRSDYQLPGFALVKAHLETARQAPEYKFVLAELDYLKPYWDAFPEDRAYLRQLLAEGRVELMGGTYNEPNTNLTSAESTIRNAVYGIGFQRDVLGGDPRTAWQLDVFGHDPQFPGLMADAGLTSSSWARGPFHQWGPMLTNHRPMEDGWGDPSGMQFPADFEWLSPSGRGVLTHYMPAHYSAGWWMDSATTLAQAERAVYDLFVQLKKVAATRNVLVPVGTDYTPPSKWVVDIQRAWAGRYVWPKVRSALPREYFDAVRAELADTGRPLSPQTRDMNPIYTGKDVSFIDTKQAQRHAESALVEAETFGTYAALLGARYPEVALDKAWRQLVYGAHHDGITGSESDQVYLDLLSGWREAHDLATEVRDRALDHLAAHVESRGEGRAVVVFNPSSWPRTDLVRVRAQFPVPGSHGVSLREPDGTEIPVLLEHAERHPDGTLAAADLVFVASGVPSVGYRSLRLLGTVAPSPVGWQVRGDAAAIETGSHRIEVDPERGGCVSRWYDKRNRREILQPGRVGNEILVYEEYPAHPRMSEGPWHLLPKGPVVGSASAPATSVTILQCPLGERITVTGQVGEVSYTQEITLWHNTGRVDCATHVDEFTGADRLLRLRWPVAVPGGLPVSEVGAATVGRGFGLVDVDSAEAPWTLDNPALHWFALSSTARIRLGDPDGTPVGTRAIGVAEIVTDDAEPGRELSVGLVRQGVTATCSGSVGPRYGNLAVDSNLPDVRIALAVAGRGWFADRVLGAADAAYRAEVDRQLAATGRARVWVPAAQALEKAWVPNADLTDTRALPVLLLVGADAEALRAEVAAVVEDLADATVEVTQPAALSALTEPDLDDFTVGLVNRGMPGFAVDPGGALHLSLMRSCTGWPSGIWIDPPRRTAPDGSTFQQQHWTHTFEYSLVAEPGDWRQARLVPHGHGVNHPLHARVLDPAPGLLAEKCAFLQVEPAGDVVLSTVKPVGNPLATGRPVDREVIDEVTVRLYEATGTPARAWVISHWPLHGNSRTDLLEQHPVPLPQAANGAQPVPVEGMEIVTLTGHPVPHAGGPVGAPSVAHEHAALEARLRAEAVVLGPDTEPAQPVYARYWLHNSGPAPRGNLPVAVHLSAVPGLYGRPVDEPFELRLTVASDSAGPVEGTVRLVAPEGWAVEPAERPFALPAGGHLETPVMVTRPADVAGGVYWLAARLAYGGQEYEDVVRIATGDIDPAVPELVATLDTEAVRLAAGEVAAVRVTLRSAARTEVRGQAWWLSPWGSWQLCPEWTQGFAVPAGGETTLEFAHMAPPGCRPGRWWGLVKLAWGGRVHYTECVPVEVTGAGG